jgi:hypothetical protein
MSSGSGMKTYQRMSHFAFRNMSRLTEHLMLHLLPFERFNFASQDQG